MVLQVAPRVASVYSTASGGNYENRELPASPGEVVYVNGKHYRFVMNGDAVSFAVGDLVCFTSLADDYKEASSDRAGGTSENGRPAGVALSIVPAGDHGWIQVTGIGEVAVVTDGGVIAEDELIAHATTNGGFDTGVYAAASDPSTKPHAVAGYALAADTSTALAIGEYVLECPTNSQPDMIA